MEALLPPRSPKQASRETARSNTAACSPYKESKYECRPPPKDPCVYLLFYTVSWFEPLYYLYFHKNANPNIEY